MSEQSHVIAERHREDHDMQLVAGEGYARGIVVVGRRSADVRISEAEVIVLLRSARVKLTDDVKRRVRQGVDLVNADPELVSRFLAAKGVPAVPGRDARPNWVVEPHRRCEYARDEDDRIDYRTFEDTGTVDKGQLLLVIEPEEHGRPGLNIFGEVINPHAGRPAGVRRGRNVRVSDDGQRYYAAETGRVSFQYDVLSVEHVYHVRGDVDFSTGNIDFPGPVVIRGDVLAGFEVKSGDGIEIYGTVESGRVVAARNIAIHGGVNGRGKGFVKCGGSLWARYLNSVEIEAGGNVKITKSVVHSTVRCKGSLKVYTDGVISSRIYAGRDVDVPILGSERGVETFVAAGLDVGYEREIEEVDARAHENAQERLKLRHTLGVLVDDPTRLLEIRPVARRLQLSIQLRRFFDLEHEANGLRERRDELESRTREAASSRIRVTRMVWQGVRLRIGESQLAIRGPRRGPLEFVPGKKALLAV